VARVTRACLVWALCILTFGNVAYGTVTMAAQPPPPLLTDTVNDLAKVIDGPSARELDRRIRALQLATGDVVVVATVQTFQPYADITEYAVKMFENGGKGIGARGTDNGLLIVVAVADRKIGIEVGYGLEGFVTDGFAGQTIRDTIRPAFRQQQYGQGLVAGTTRIINRIAEGRGVQVPDVPVEVPAVAPVGTRSTRDFSNAIRVLLFILFIVFMMSRRGGRRRRHWGMGPWSGWNSGVGPFGGSHGGFGGGFGGFGGGGSRGGGGFGGFGGGRSGGGGASGGW
jgi:uncharacterized protein